MKHNNCKQNDISDVEFKVICVIGFITYTWLVVLVTIGLTKPVTDNENKDLKIQRLQMEVMKCNSAYNDSLAHKNCIRVGL